MFIRTKVFVGLRIPMPHQAQASLGNSCSVFRAQSIPPFTKSFQPSHNTLVTGLSLHVNTVMWAFSPVDCDKLKDKHHVYSYLSPPGSQSSEGDNHPSNTQADDYIIKITLVHVNLTSKHFLSIYSISDSISDTGEASVNKKHGLYVHRTHSLCRRIDIEWVIINLKYVKY